MGHGYGCGYGRSHVQKMLNVLVTGSVDVMFKLRLTFGSWVWLWLGSTVRVKLCSRYVKDMLKLCQRYVDVMFKLCSEYVEDTFKLCQG